MKLKIPALLRQLNHGLVEREPTLKIVLLTVLARENIVLIGPPGTGKSLIARRIAESFAGATRDGNHAYFEYLLTKFSTPEEIFGPLSITALKADCFKRNTTGYLPAVQVAFLDEIFKASSSILNALLTILNERVYHNGAEVQKVPLQSLIAASNELPSDQAELSALYDRFLVRGFVDYVSQNNLHRLFEKATEYPESAQLTVADLDHIQHDAEAVVMSPEIVQAIQSIWIKHQELFKEDRRESLSDRRLKKIIKLLCVSAATNGRSEVDLSDVFLLKDCLWNHPDNAEKVRGLILKALQTISRQVRLDKNATIATPAEVPPKSSGKMNFAVKGLKGCGTAQDPLLIATVEELLDLARPDVGLKGYHFRQTADIDASTVTTWPEISFQGHYDGVGHTIKKQNFQIGFFGFDIDNSSLLFSVIFAQSSITNLKLDGLSLTHTAVSSHITHCTSTKTLIKEQATGCVIKGCQSVHSLIGKDAIKCTITRCKSANSLILEAATNCTITDCLVVSTQL